MPARPPITVEKRYRSDENSLAAKGQWRHVMPNTNPHDTLDTNASEWRRNRFEAVWLAWRPGASLPRWQDHLPADDESCNSQLIFDLLQIDIECRIKAGLPALLAERYFEHPRLHRTHAPPPSMWWI
jgi:hypothetical protein